MSRPLGGVHVLVGPNGSGKSTFLDVVAFMGQLLENGLEASVRERSTNFRDLLFRKEGTCFELAIEALIPEDQKRALAGRVLDGGMDRVRYEIKIGASNPDQPVGILHERLLFRSPDLSATAQSQINMFPVQAGPPDSLKPPDRSRQGSQRGISIISKVPDGGDNFYSEVYPGGGKGWVPSFRLGPRKSALGNLPDDESKFPVATWFRSLLTTGVQPLTLNSLLIRRASAPGQGRGFRSDGSNLPWVIDDLKKKNSARFSQWIAHVQTALPDIEDIRVSMREDDHHAYTMLRYRGGLEIPSWMVSDGTLRLLALTIPAYLPDFTGVYLVEEPENGIHPLAVETVFKSLSSIYGGQVLVASHSPIVLSYAEDHQVLCFAKTERGETVIVPGDKHPDLADWQGKRDMGNLLASGILG